jgi:hypothetical protein
MMAMEVATTAPFLPSSSSSSTTTIALAGALLFPRPPPLSPLERHCRHRNSGDAGPPDIGRCPRGARLPPPPSLILARPRDGGGWDDGVDDPPRVDIDGGGGGRDRL